MTCGLRRILFDLLPQPLDQRVDAADGDKRLILPHAAEERFAAEDDARARQQHVEQLELVRRQLDVRLADADAAPRRVHLDVLVGDRTRGFFDPAGLTSGRGPRRSSARTRATSSRTPNGFVR